jgi:3'(2'), 5'-bisphosphate nucleotidase
MSDLSVGLEAVEKACAYLMDAYSRFEIIADAPANITTECDRRAQEIILKHLHDAFPKDALCAEETTTKLAPVTGKRVWIVDPIDGTRGFARKNGEFSVMVALVEEGNLEVGIVAQPALGRLTYATCGQGCWRRDGKSKPVRCAVSDASAFDKATLTQSRSKDKSKKTPVVEALHPAKVVETYSAGVKLALVARGEADVYVNDYDQFHDWDIAAGHLLVSEAGGTVTDFRGQRLRYGLPGAWQSNGLVATNGRLHAETLERIPKTAK